MAKKVELEIDVKSNTGPSIQKLKELRNEIKKTVAGSAEFNKITQEIKDIEDALEESKAGAKGFKDMLEEAPGPIGNIFQGMRKLEIATKGTATAFKALGIGLLVSAVAGLAAAFTQSEAAVKKLQPLMDGLGKILNGIFAAVEPLFNAFIDLAIEALPFVTKGIGIFYASLVTLVTYVKEAGLALYNFWAGLLTLDFERVGKAVESGIGSFGKAGDAFTETMKRFEEGTKQQTKSEKEELEKQEEARKKAFEERIKRMELQDKLDKAMMDKLKAETLALAKTEQEKLDIERKFAEMANKARLQDIADRQKLYSKDSEEFKNLQIEKINAEAEYVKQTADFIDKQKALDEAAKKAADEKRKEEEDKLKESLQIQRDLRLLDIQSQLEEIDRASQAKQNDFLEDIKRLDDKRAKIAESQLIELQNTELNELQIAEIKKKYADQLRAIDEQQLKLEQDIVAQREINRQVVLGLANAVGQLAQAFGEETQAGIALIKVQQALALSTTISAIADQLKGIGQAIKLPFPANIAAVTVTLGTIATAVAQFKSLFGISPKDLGKGGTIQAAQQQPSMGRNYAVGGLINGPRHAQGGVMINAEGGEAVMTRGAVTMFAPLLSAMNQMGGGTSFNTNGNVAPPDKPDNNNGNNQSPIIVKTYVVENELTTEQERQARLKDLSTL